MKIQINAAQRLITANADEKAARSYLESLGVDAGALKSHGRDFVEFEVPFDSFDEIKDKLSKKLGRPKLQPTLKPSVRLKWEVEGKGSVNLFKNESYWVHIYIQNKG